MLQSIESINLLGSSRADYLLQLPKIYAHTLHRCRKTGTGIVSVIKPESRENHAVLATRLIARPQEHLPANLFIKTGEHRAHGRCSPYCVGVTEIIRRRRRPSAVARATRAAAEARRARLRRNRKSKRSWTRSHRYRPLFIPPTASYHAPPRCRI